MEYKCEECNRNFGSEESFRQHNTMKHASYKKEKSKINFKKYFIFAAIIVIVVLLVLSINGLMKKPGQYDDFVNCLNEKGAIVYGNDYCSYTIQQLNYFGKSKEALNYVKCVDNEVLCNSKGVSITPTWEINGETYSGVQTFEKLSSVTGCKI